MLWQKRSAVNSELEAFSRRLETVLNADGASPFEAVAISELQPALVQRYQRFRQDFPEVTWRVEPAAPLEDGRQTLLLQVVVTLSRRGCATSWKQRNGLRFA